MRLLQTILYFNAWHRRALVMFVLFAGLYVGMGKLKPEWRFSKIKFFEVEDVVIHSEWPLAHARIKSWLPPLVGKSILTISASELLDLLKDKPWVEAVTVKKEYPNRIAVSVETKHPQAIYLHQGQGYFLDSSGLGIEKVTPLVLRNFDLPVISLARERDESGWDMAEVTNALSTIQKRISPRFRVSQVVLGSFPHLRFFLSPAKIELVLDFRYWEKQFPQLEVLLFNPPSQLGKLRKIHLVFPKKAVVSSLLSN